MNTLVTVTYTVFKSIESLRRQRSSLIALRWRGDDGQSKVCQRDNKDEYEHGSKIKFDRSGREHENRLSHTDHCLLLIFIHSGMVTYRRGRDWKIFIFKCIVKSQWNTHTAVVVLYTLTYEDGDGLAYEVFFLAGELINWTHIFFVCLVGCWLLVSVIIEIIYQNQHQHEQLCFILMLPFYYSYFLPRTRYRNDHRNVAIYGIQSSE